jgi:hypothetical protein
MKYLKMLGLAAVAAMALTAFLGASSASATVLCTTTPPAGTACGTGWHVDELTLAVGANPLILKNTSGSIEAKCTKAGVTVTKDVTGSATTTAAGEVPKTHLTWAPKGEGCTNKTETIAGGTLEIHWIEGTDNGTVTAKGFEVTVELAGLTCTLGLEGTKSIGDLTGGAPAVMHVNVGVVKKAGSFLCPTTGIWEGTYEVTNHTTVDVVKE